MYTRIEQLSKCFSLLEWRLPISKERKLNDPCGKEERRGRETFQEAHTPRQVEVQEAY